MHVNGLCVYTVPHVCVFVGQRLTSDIGTQELSALGI